MTFTVGYQGVPGSFSYLAALAYFGGESLLLGSDRFETLFKMVEDERATHAILPIENSLAGSIQENYDLLSRYPLHISGEYYLHVEHNLVGIADPTKTTPQRLLSISRITSHPKAFEQCQLFLGAHPWMERIIHSDTGGAARMVAEKQDPHLAAISSRDAANLYKLEILQANIEDDPHNFTRFFVIQKHKERVEGANKCSLTFALPHTPGSLYRSMQILADKGLNITKIESRPIHGKPFQYSFHIDFEFEEKRYEETLGILQTLGNQTVNFKILGYYRASRPAFSGNS